MTHALKTSLRKFYDIENGYITADLRKYDRNYVYGDKIIFQEFDELANRYTDREIEMLVVSITRDVPGLAKQYCIVTFAKSLPTPEVAPPTEPSMNTSDGPPANNGKSKRKATEVATENETF